MEIKGKIVQVLPLQGGQSKAGNEWRKQEYILETDAQYPKKVCFNLWGDKIDQYPLAIGEDVIASIDVESREFNGRWYTEVRAWKIDKVDAMMGGDSTASPMPPVDFFAANPEQSSTDDLPF